MEQDSNDAEHLRLLSIFHYVVAGLAGLFGTFPIIHVTMGILLLQGAFDKPGRADTPPAAIGWVFVVFGGVAILFCWTLAALLVMAGRLLARRRGYTFCLTAAGIACIFMPFGTVLGVFTIIVLVRPSVKRLFGRPADVRAVEPNWGDG